MESMFIVKDPNSQEQRTFWRDEKLPPLPLPELQDTAEKYLDSCKPVLTDEEYAKTKSIVGNFMAVEGAKLHKQLEEKSKKVKNWLDDWWLDGYLEFRGPSGYLNFSAIADYSYWPLKNQLKSCALHLHLTMKFWLLIREEKLRQQSDAKGNPFSMYQFRYLFNTCRIPLPARDDLVCWFQSKYEGSCPSHVIVFYKKRMYKIQTLCPKTGELYTPSQIHKILLEIVKEEVQEGPGIANLSELDRDTWAEARTHLMELSPVNEANIHEVESAVMCLTIGDENPPDTKELNYGIANTNGHRWMDKLNLIVTPNSQFILHSDHTPLDGMVIVTMMSYMNVATMSLKTGLDKIWGDDSLTFEMPNELRFQVDDKLRNWINEGEKVAEKIRSQVDSTTLFFKKFGRKGLKKLGRIHPCGFVEICLQLAYIRKHGKPAPTYETATTRTFYRGRTETMRTCTPEMVAFCKAMINGEPNQRAMFTEACEKYFSAMEECKVGKGCDRHLLGLATVAAKNGDELPQLFKDPAFVKSGGNGNFVLSTSFIGYSTPANGGVVPMRQDGYGVFYQMGDNAMGISVIALDHEETDAESYAQYVEQALIDVYKLMTPDSSKL